MEDKQMSKWVAAGVIEGKNGIELKEIMEIVCLVFGREEKEVNTKSRRRDLVTPRHVFCYLSKKYTDKILKEIGDYISKDHSSVYHSITSTENLMETDKRINDLVKKCEMKIEGTIGQLIKI